MGNTPNPDSTWTDFLPVASSGATIGGSSRYAQYRASLSTAVPGLTPALQSVTLGYTANADAVAPTIISKSPAPNAAGVGLFSSVVVKFSELMNAATIGTSTVHLRIAGDGNDVAATVSYAGSTLTIQPTTALLGNTLYQVIVNGGVSDSSGNAIGSDVIWSFTTGGGQWQQTTVADFSAGTLSGTSATNSSGGEVQLAETIRDDFSGASLGSAWVHTSWESSGGGTESISVSNGVLTLAGTQIRSNQTFTAKPVEGRISFAAASYQHFGVATDLSTVAADCWAVFSTGGTTNQLFARVNNQGAYQEVNLGSLPSGFHLYRISPTASGFAFYVDNALQTTINITFPTDKPLHIAFSMFNGSATGAMQADWVRLVDYPDISTFISSVFDATRAATWGAINWNAILPAGTSIVIETRSGDTSSPDSSWTDWTVATNGGTVGSPSARFLQYRIRFVTTDPTVSATVFDVTIDWN